MVAVAIAVATTTSTTTTTPSTTSRKRAIKIDCQEFTYRSHKTNCTTKWMNKPTAACQPTNRTNKQTYVACNNGGKANKQTNK